VTRAWLRPHHESQTIRVLTFNILSIDHAAWERRRRVARSELQAIRPDIVALQETTPGDAHDEATDLLGPGYHIVEHPSGSGDTVGAALASRWPFAAVHKLDLSVRPRVPSAAAVLAEVAARPVWTDRFRSSCGAWEAKRAVDAGHTFSPSNPLVRAGEMPLEPGRRIDYIMIRSGIHGRPWRLPSVAECSPSRWPESGRVITSASWLICKSHRCAANLASICPAEEITNR
jgi:hypothetical protein